MELVHPGRAAKRLTWHWSPNNGFALNHEIRGWNECLIAYVLAASSPRYPIAGRSLSRRLGDAAANSSIGAVSRASSCRSGRIGAVRSFSRIFPFCGIDPRGLSDAYADYWRQNVNHTMINYAYCVRNPKGYKGYGPNCWGLNAGDTFAGYSADAPDNDRGVISPSAALPSFRLCSTRVHGRRCAISTKISATGFGDASASSTGSASSMTGHRRFILAISQGPIVVMIENYRTGLMWKLFMSIPEIQAGMKKLGFRSPHFALSPTMTDLPEWIEGEARFAAKAMCERDFRYAYRHGTPRLRTNDCPHAPDRCSPLRVLADYDPDPDYFFHWFRDSAIVIDALRVALAEGIYRPFGCRSFLRVRGIQLVAAFAERAGIPPKER